MHTYTGSVTSLLPITAAVYADSFPHQSHCLGSVRSQQPSYTFRFSRLYLGAENIFFFMRLAVDKTNREIRWSSVTTGIVLTGCSDLSDLSILGRSNCPRQRISCQYPTFTGVFFDAEWG